MKTPLKLVVNNTVPLIPARNPDGAIVQLWKYAAFFIIVVAIAAALCAIGYALSWGTK